ncbi:type II toxin-antitoxin system HicA family toxin [Deinococcus sp. HMF7604]|nr:type II toxin-antitoxin system HicA family toxin [Deinococcus betulae]
MRQLGFEPQSGLGKGDHEVWAHREDKTRYLTLDPGQDPPKKGTFKQMLRTAFISEDFFR